MGDIGFLGAAELVGTVLTLPSVFGVVIAAPAIIGIGAGLGIWFHHYLKHQRLHDERDLASLLSGLTMEDLDMLPVAAAHAPHSYFDDIHTRLQQKGYNNTVVSIKHGDFCFYYGIFDDELARQRQAEILSVRVANAIEAIPQGRVAMSSHNGTVGKFQDMSFDELRHFTDTVLGAQSLEYESL